MCKKGRSIKERIRGTLNSNLRKILHPLDEASGSNNDKHQRFDKGKCSYCKKGNHTEKGCIKKTIDQMKNLLERQNISLPEGARKDEN